jgi:hypothetical protein
VRNAIARFDQVEDVTDRARDQAWRRILRAAKRFGIEVEADDWRQLCRRREGQETLTPAPPTQRRNPAVARIEVGF